MKSKLPKLLKLAKLGQSFAHSPYSKVNVGASLQTDSGKYFYGANIENSSYGNTICAERVAIFKMVSEGHQKIKRIYVFTKDGWPPCGACRQVMTEFAGPDLEIILGDSKGREFIYTLNELFPLAFNPKHLKKKDR